MTVVGELETPFSIQLKGETFQLFAEGAAFWEMRRTLLIADPHFGKSAVFRSAGIPLPEGDTVQDLERLSGILQETDAQRLIVLGDFFHGRASLCKPVLDALDGWRDRHASLEVHLIAGNHDLRAGFPPENLNFKIHEKGMVEHTFTLLHEPRKREGQMVLCGHLHPAVRLKNGRRGERLQLPCFHQTRDFLILPAFGTFTGTAVIQPQLEDRIYAIAGERVIALPPFG